MFWFIAFNFAMIGIAIGISYLFPQSGDTLKPAKPTDFKLPTAEEGRFVPAIWGLCDLPGPNAISEIIALEAHPKKEHGEVVAYKYVFGLHYELCLGNIDGVKQYWLENKCLWPTVNDSSVLADDSVTYDLVEYLDGKYVFGGWQRGGGFYGGFHFLYGAETQTLTTTLDTYLGGDVPAYRGRTTVLFYKCYWGTTGYLKPARFVAKRTALLHDGSDQWYPAKATIATNWLNPVHMIREKLTSTVCGIGKSVDLIGDSFTTAADTLYTENFGLGYREDHPDDARRFLDLVQQHIDGLIYVDRSTGKYEIALARDDYDAGSLTTYDMSDIMEVLEFSRPAYGKIPSLTVVQWHDPITGKDRIAEDDDPALMEIQGGKHIIQELAFPMIGVASLAATVAAREQRDASSMLATIKFRAKRTMAHLHPGSVFKVSLTQLGITSMIVRALGINYGNIAEGELEFSVTEDVFGAAETTYASPPDTGAGSPNNDAADVTDLILTETPYWVSCNHLLGTADTNGLPNDAGMLLVCARPPTDDHLAYRLLVRHAAGQDFIERATAGFATTATLVSALPQAADDVTIELTGMTTLAFVDAHTLAQIGDELLYVISVDSDNDTVTVARGALDTVPVTHHAGERIYFLETGWALLPHEYTAADTPAVKLLGSTALGELAEGSATIHTADAFSSRLDEPYAPGNLRIAGVAYPVSIPETGDVVVSWAHRDRTDSDQIAQVIKQSDSTDYGPEATATYTIEIYDQDGSLVRTATGESGTTYTYTNATERSDCGLGTDDPLNRSLRFRIWTVVGSYTSWQVQDVTVQRSPLDPLYMKDEIVLMMAGANAPY